MKRASGFLCVALLAGGVSTGCADVSTSAQPAERPDEAISAQELQEGHAAQAAMMADGAAGRDEYLRAMRLFAGCLERHDLQLTEQGWNPVDHRSIDYTYANERLSDERVLAVGNACQQGYLDRVQTAYAESVRPYLDPDLLAPARKCIAGKGLASSPTDIDVRAMIKTAGDISRKTVSDCVGRAAQAKYPDRMITVRG